MYSIIIKSCKHFRESCNNQTKFHSQFCIINITNTFAMKISGVLLAAILLSASAIPMKVSQPDALITGIQPKEALIVQERDTQQPYCDTECAFSESGPARHNWLRYSLQVISSINFWPALYLGSVCNDIPDIHPLKSDRIDELDILQDQEKVPAKRYHFEQPGVLAGMIVES